MKNKFIYIILFISVNVYAGELSDFGFNQSTVVLLNTEILYKPKTDLSAVIDVKDDDSDENNTVAKTNDFIEPKLTVNVVDRVDSSDENSFIDDFISDATAEKPPLANSVSQNKNNRIEELRKNVLGSSINSVNETVEPVTAHSLSKRKKELKKLESSFKQSQKALEKTFSVTNSSFTSKVLSSSDFNVKWGSN